MTVLSANQSAHQQANSNRLLCMRVSSPSHSEKTHPFGLSVANVLLSGNMFAFNRPCQVFFTNHDLLVYDKLLPEALCC